MPQTQFVESKHKRYPKGSALGGKFAPKTVDRFDVVALDKKLEMQSKASSNAEEVLSVKHNNAIYNYTGAGFMKINKFLRDPNGGGYIDGEIDSIKEDVTLIDDAFKKLDPLEENITVFRGISSNRTNFEDLTAGDVLNDSGFVSTTLELEDAVPFSASRQKQYNAIFEIRAASGTPVIFASNHSGYPEEDELLFPRNAKVKIIETKEPITMFGDITVQYFVAELSY